MLKKIEYRASIPFSAARFHPIVYFFISASVLLITLLASPNTMAKTLNIATINVAPFGFYTEDNKPTGMMFEISNLIAEEAGIEYQNKILPYARTSYEVANGDSDFVLRYTNEKLTEDAIQVVSVVPMRNIVIGLAGIEYKTLNDLHGKTVASVRGAVFDKPFSDATEILKNETHDYRQGLMMLFNNRLDAVIGSNVGIYYTALKMNYHPEQLGKPLLLSTKHFWLHFSKKNADDKTIAELRSATIRLQQQGKIQEIIKKYMGEYKYVFDKTFAVNGL
ncbi:MAG: transporter substrate-binding domain-containing protein [Oleispira sp.]